MNEQSPRKVLWILICIINSEKPSAIHPLGLDNPVSWQEIKGLAGEEG